MELTILYRGPLSSCNYRCDYCPFAKRHETARELTADRLALERFAAWVESRTNDRLSVLFTPWGEAMTRRWYRETIARFTHWPQIDRVAIQTNLSWDTSWATRCDVQRLGLWCTWHPTEVSMESFLDRCENLDRMRVRYSVGMVGIKESYRMAVEMRTRLDASIYLWVNAYKDVSNYYSSQEVDQWTSIDPLFPINLRNHASFGQACRTGQRVISVDGEGTVRRCHFIPDVLGNLYTDQLDTLLRPRACSNQTCDCHIGYMHLESLGLDAIFGDGLLMRDRRR
jgi:MoaA/NifB/PqqE/SkfB family radical SAM enzyme